MKRDDPSLLLPRCLLEAKNICMTRYFRLLLPIAIVGALVANSSGEAFAWATDYNRLLGKYAGANGVRYADWKNNGADVQTLQKVVDAIAAENINSLGQKEQLAFYVNAYNAWILHEALAKYPTSSVKDALFTFFTSKRIKVAGQQTSFNALEKETIRSKFNDPRIHFALNCASRSCPPLNPEAFTGEKLDGQFEKLAKNFVNSEKGVRMAEEKSGVELSKIFDWYKDDFKDGGPLQFINKRRSTAIPADAKITYQDYDWALNDAK